MYRAWFFLLISLAVCGLTSPRAGARPPAMLTLEAEQAAWRGGAVEARSGASGGKCLGDGWGGQTEHRADFRFTLPAAQECALGIFYAYDREQYLRRFPGTPTPHGLRVLLDDREIAARVACPDTADWNVFACVRVPLGALAAGSHVLRLCPAGTQNDMNLDRVVLAGADYAPDTRAAVTLPAASRHFRLRLSPRVDAARFPARQVLAFLEAQHAYLRDFLGFSPERTGLLTVVADADWTVGASAYTAMGNVYLREREIGVPGNNYAHEMFHFFEEGMDYPTWWSEGLAYLVFLRSESAIYGRKQEELDAQAADLRAWWEQEGRRMMVRDGVNQIVWWGSDRLPEGISEGALYRTANLMLADLWRREGDSFFRRLYALLRADRAAGRYRIPAAPFEEKNRLLFGYIERAAGHSMADFRQAWNLASPPPDPASAPLRGKALAVGTKAGILRQYISDRIPPLIKPRPVRVKAAPVMHS